MHINQFTAFYPSRPYWAGSKVNLADIENGRFNDQMSEEVFSQKREKYTLKVCRDGRIMLRVEAIEHATPHMELEATVAKWGDYLDHLNTFYLLLDSASLDVVRMSYFSLHELTNRDAFRVRYEHGKSTGENIAIESIASVFQMARYLSSYRPGLPLELDPQISMRREMPLSVIEHAERSFYRAIELPGLIRALASFAKSLSEYKVGNYETSIVLAWFIIEAAISNLWKSQLAALDCELDAGRKRINAERKKFLTGRDFTISAISNILELWGLLPNDEFQDIDTVRGFRNKIVHRLGLQPGAEAARLALETAQKMIARQWNFNFTPSFSYSVTGL